MTQSIISTNVEVRYPWMFGKAFDVSFYYLPILIGAAVFALTSSLSLSPFWAAVFLTSFGAGPFHQGATWFAFFDKQNREYYNSTRQKQFIFYVAPTLILLLSVVLACVAPAVVQLIWLLWSLQHLVQQNVGILLLYHNHGKGEAIVERPLEVLTLRAAGVLFTLIFFYRDILKGGLPNLMLPVIAVALIFTLFHTGQYIIALRKQLQAGSYLNAPALMFWISSMLCLFPLAFIGQSFNDGYIIPVTVHWFQYNGLNYVLVKNKYKDEKASNLPIRQALMLFFVFCLLIVALTFGLYAIESVNPLQKAIIGGIILGLGNVHYFLDAFLWKFREPYQRQAILPYLLANR